MAKLLRKDVLMVKQSTRHIFQCDKKKKKLRKAICETGYFHALIELAVLQNFKLSGIL